MTSPVAPVDSAVPIEAGVDAGAAWHFGDPLREQRLLARSAGVVDRSNRGVLLVPGEDRLDWLHTICSQHVADLSEGDSTEALVLSPHGHVEQHWQVTELDGQVWLDVEPGQAEEVLAYLNKMRFFKRVEPTDVSAQYAVISVVGPLAADFLAAASLPVPELGRAVALADGGFRRCASRPGGRGWAWRPTTAPSRTRSVGSGPRCT
jgi:folate-binding Fe-S cluster repair protein YgfZ